MKVKVIIAFSLLFVSVFYSNAQSFNSTYFNAMQWRCIGPHRGGRTVGATGVPSQPNVFYIGVNNGGVWKTTDFGRTWNPIFDDQPTGSVGDVVVSPSNPNVLYVGSGEGLQRPDLSVGDGIYKSTDAGKTWINTGLKNAQQIGGLAIDPANENRLFVAALGHPYGANEERGVYRTVDGGKTWERVLYKDENTGAIQVTIDPNNANIVYADMWAGRQGPWENGAWNGKESGLFKSTDGGTTWKKLTAGLPTTEQGLGRIGFCIAPSNSNRLYATVDAGKYGGIYRSDDAGESWIMINSDERLWGRGSDFAEIKADPINADIVYSADVVTWKSVDAGKTWTAFRGAPGGDDYHRIWINPNNNKIILIASDQGAIITVNAGETFSSWYNQPTAQFYHVSTDNSFPYNVYSGQQESGSVGITSRGNDGSISFRDWHPVGAEEYGYVVADPLDNNIIYGGKISRYDKRTGQAQNIAPEAVRSGKYRFLRTAPVLFNPIDNKTLYYAGNVLFKTTTGGSKWDIISPDLSRESYAIPENVGIYASMYKDSAKITVVARVKVSSDGIGTFTGFGTNSDKTSEAYKNEIINYLIKIRFNKADHESLAEVPFYFKKAETPLPRRGVIYTVAPSYVDVNTIWCGTDDGLIHVTHDGGKTWKNVTPAQITSWSKVSLMDASHTDKNTAYAAVNKIRLDDMKPHIYKTTDGGKTWTEIVNGLPNDPINVVKEDPKRKGLLFAGSERAVYVSFDDGANWQSLRLNMPATSIRDLVIKDDDLVIGTHGRSFWILDDITPLRFLSDVAALVDLPIYNFICTPKTTTRVRWNMNTDTPVPQEESAGKNPPDGAIINYYLNKKADKVYLRILDSKKKVVREYSSADTAYKIGDVNIPHYWIRPQKILSAEAGSHRFTWDMHYQPLNVPPSYPIAAIYGNTAPNETSPWVMPGRYTAILSLGADTTEYIESFEVKMDPRVKTSAKDLQLQHDLSMMCYNNIKKCMAELRGLDPNSEKAKTLSKYINDFSSIENALQESDWPPTTQMIKAAKETAASFAKFLSH